jgi:hypothetical protein
MASQEILSQTEKVMRDYVAAKPGITAERHALGTPRHIFLADT